MQGLFLALRAVTQRDLDYFLAQRDMIEIFLDQEEPMFPISETEPYASLDYKTLLNLVNHIGKLTPDKEVSTVIKTVVLLRSKSLLIIECRHCHFLTGSLCARDTSGTKTKLPRRLLKTNF